MPLVQKLRGETTEAVSTGAQGGEKRGREGGDKEKEAVKGPEQGRTVLLYWREHGHGATECPLGERPSCLAALVYI